LAEHPSIQRVVLYGSRALAELLLTWQIDRPGITI
jgi:hypothetical protein